MKGYYFTISSESDGLFKDRGSKFYAFAYPVYSEEEVKEHLDELRKKYHDARHHCYAWRLGAEGEHTRANDDGEPSSSAGKPILNQIEKKELTNVLVVVVRYFGGTLLGVGGLINAYRTATASALEKASLIKKFVYNIYELAFEYPLMNQVMKLIKEHSLETYDQVFELSCSLKVKVELEKTALVVDQFHKVLGCTLSSLGQE